MWTGERSRTTPLALAIVDAQSGAAGRRAYVVASGTTSACPSRPSDDYFNPAFMQCQYEYGRRLALEDGSSWQVRIDTLSPFEIKPVTQRHPCAR
jgi:hypothetical protein